MQAGNEKDPHGRALIEKNDLGEELGRYLKARNEIGRNVYQTIQKHSCVLPVNIHAALRQVLPMLFLHTRFALFCNHKISK